MEGDTELSSGQVLRGIEVHLDLEHDSGYALVRDSVPRCMLDKFFKGLAVIGWHAVEDDETVEPYDFEDGTTGVQIWLYRLARAVEAILRDAKVA